MRSALLIAADLRGATFDRTDLLGADLRDANRSGADLRGAIFLTQQQVDAARGNGSTRLPSALHTPSHWN
ncbi:pentapeptide repeat-containing protein [Luteococcus peritonei]|uniref:Pentapeptide repeat-containing protein n=1 Tax=Luteococcus peritonei TaxID=88874 RepID=A0ABW4RWV9_9ACTN